MMRFTVVALVAIACLLSSLIPFSYAQKPSAVRFRQASHASPGNIVELSGVQDFDALVTYPRDFSVSLLLTAVDSPPVQCGPCKLFQPVYQTIARNFRKIANENVRNQHIFSYLEFKNGREVFQKLQLQYAPVLLYFPPTAGPRAAPSPDPEPYDFNRLGFDGGDVAEDLSKKLGVKVPFSKPFPWQLAGTVAASVATFALLLFFVLPRISTAIGSSSDTQNDGKVTLSSITGFFVKIVTLATITVMCAGHMWNGIRNAPYVSTDGAGKPQYFASGFQNQNAAETQIVAIIYGILAFSVVSLAVLVPTQRDPVRQRAGVYVWSAIMLAAFSLLLYIFRLKNPSYPFRLFF